MATLSGQTIANTFDSILHVEDDTAGLVATSTDSRVIQDGVGANSALALATDSVRVTSTNKLYINDVGDEYISGDATDLTIASGNDLNLTATTDINIPASVGLTFGHASNQKIEGDGTDLSIDATGNINVTSTVDEAASIYLHANAGTSETVKVHADQGTGAASLNLLSDAGGITLSAGNTSHGVIVGDVSGAPVTIGHTTSETTVNDNLTVTGDLAVTGDLDMEDDKGIKFGSDGDFWFGPDEGEATIELYKGDRGIDGNEGYIFFRVGDNSYSTVLVTGGQGGDAELALYADQNDNPLIIILFKVKPMILE